MLIIVRKSVIRFKYNYPISTQKHFRPLQSFNYCKFEVTIKPCNKMGNQPCTHLVQRLQKLLPRFFKLLTDSILQGWDLLWLDYWSVT